MPKVSVCIPIFGVEKYIERCARSLFEQTLDDMEFIFVDDCTQDNSIAVLETVLKEYPKCRCQTKIIHHEVNKGLSFARETGVKAATGDYIAHCDSDDWVEKEMYEVMYDYAVSGAYGIVKCAHYVASKSEIKKIPIYGENSLVDNDDALGYLFSCHSWNTIWTLIVDRKMYENISFTRDAMLEDFVVVSQLLLKRPKIGCVNTPYYYYYQNSNSICGVVSIDAYVERGNQAKRNISKILSYIPAEYSSNHPREIIRLKYEARNRIIPIMNQLRNYKIWETTYPEIGLYPLVSPYLSLKEKLQYFLIQTRLYPLFKMLKE